MKSSCFLLALAILLVSCSVSARTWYITPEGTGDAPTIEAAVDSAASGDTVLVADGTHTFMCASFSGKDLTVLSESQNPEAARLISGSSTFFMTDYSTLTLSGFHIASGGSGIFFWRSDAFVSNCVFEYVYTVVTCDTSAYASFTSCDFIDSKNGVCMVEEGSEVVYTSCTFLRNDKHPAGGIFVIGRDCDLSLTGCTLVDNEHLFAGWIASPTRCYGLYLTNCIVAFNDDTIVTGDDFCEVVLTCCDVYGNSEGDWVGWLAGQEGSRGNFSANPLFCDIPSGDLTVEDCSPCLPGSHPDGYDCGGIIGAHGSGCGCGTANEPTRWGLIKSMYR